MTTLTARHRCHGEDTTKVRSTVDVEYYYEYAYKIFSLLLLFFIVFFQLFLHRKVQSTESLSPLLQRFLHYLQQSVVSVLTDSKSQPRRQPLKNAEKEHHEINRKAQATDQSVTSLMGELQHTEAKQADLKHTISENEAEIDRIASRLENQKKQIEKIETTTIPMKYQVWMAGLASSRKRLVRT
jgi:septal ring factor EnvC (AmiA/AmiB activator)